jgi:hypothetical protein
MRCCKEGELQANEGQLYGELIEAAKEAELLVQSSGVLVAISTKVLSGNYGKRRSVWVRTSATKCHNARRWPGRIRNLSNPFRVT